MRLYGATELQSFIGKTGKYKVNGFGFYVVVADARTNLNILEYLVRPIAGEGGSWLPASFILLDKPTEAPKANKEEGRAILGQGEG